MARFDTTSVNPDLASERASATFNPDIITNILDKGVEKTRRRRQLEQMVIQDRKFDWPEFHFLDRGEKYNEVIRQCANFVQLIREMPDLDREDRGNLVEIIFPNVAVPIGLHLGMFTNVIEEQTTEEQKAKWLPLTKNLEIIGTYAQTELGHGTHVRALETTATYDPKTEEFVIHSPTLTATKFWPGGLGKTANHALVMAQLITQGKSHGVHPFIVPLRDLASHEPLPGVTVGDIGPKFGYDTMDNGFLRFNQFHIPRENMVMRNAQVKKDGTFMKVAVSNKLSYGAMVYTRAMIAGFLTGRSLAMATTIAIRYSCVRRQSELKPGGPEAKVLDYQTQQFKLFPLLAAVYALRFTGMRLVNDYARLMEEILAGNLNSLPELHATSSGLKALSSYMAMFGIEQCRLACGGHGYSHASGLPKIYVHVTPSATYEGENTVLYLQTARYLVKALQQVQNGTAVMGNASYLSKKRQNHSNICQQLKLDSLLEAFEHRAACLLEKASRKMRQLILDGKDAHDAWNLSSVMLVKAAESHSYVYVVESFVRMLSSASVDFNVQSVLSDLFRLFALHAISTNAADFMEDGYLSGAQLDIVNDGVLSLLNKLRPNAVALVDAFDFHDRHLGSVLGRYDGNVYENLYKWALGSPLNKTQVHKSFEYLKPVVQAHQQSKL